MRHPKTDRILLFFTGWLLITPPAAWAQLGYQLSGNLGTGFRYTREQQGDFITRITERRDDYSLGLSGRILDPRLATFSIASAFSMSDLNSNQRIGVADSRLQSFIGNLSLLPGRPYPLDLRLSQSHLSSNTDTDVLSFGGTWRLVYGALPSMLLNFDRVNIQSTGQTSADTTFTTGTMRLTKRLFTSDLEAEFGLQNFADELRGTSTLRHFGRISDTTPWSRATTLRFTGDYFIQEETRSAGSTFSLINRPDPTLSRSLSLGVRNLAGRDQEETSLDANGALSKAFQPFATLSVTPFTTTLLSQRFAANGAGDSTLLNWSSGASLVSSYLRPVLASGDYGLGLSYNKEQERQTNVGTTHQFHAGLLSRTLQPYSIRGDYTFTLERTLTDRNRHLASLRADGPIMPTLLFRSFAEFFDEDAEFTSLRTRIAAKQRSLTFGGGLTYTGIQQLYFDLGANLQRMETEASSSWVSRVTGNVTYRPTDRITFMLNGLMETDTLNRLTRFEILTRVLYQLGQVTINFEYRFESRESFGQPGAGHSVSIGINRPFRFSF